MNKDLLPLPWEKFGIAIPPGERNIIKKANLQWTVEKGTIRGLVDGQDVIVPDGFILARMPERIFLDTCGRRYKPSQNIDIFQYWKTFLSYSKLSIDYAGTAYHDRWVWAISKTKYGFSVGTGKDRIEAYLMFAHPHFCGETMRPMILLVRTINMATYTARIPMKEMMQVIPGNQWTDLHIQGARDLLTEAKKLIHEVEIKCAALVDKTINEDQAKRFFTRVLHTEERMAKLTETPETTLRMLDYFRRGPGHDLPTAMNSWWGAFQAASYFLDYQAGRDIQNRFFSALLGPRADDKRQALDLAYKILTT